MSAVKARVAFWPRAAADITNSPVRHYDMRRDDGGYAPDGLEEFEIEVEEARGRHELSLATSGFELLHAPSTVADFYDNAEVMRVYYEECRVLACRLTGATHAFTYDHLIREPGRQISGGGLDGSTHITGAEAGGGYVGAAHVDYTENTRWNAYLAKHGATPPANARRILALNFWRPVGAVVADQPLALCDARTVAPEQLFETVVHGYGPDNYSWHDLGIETYNVKYASTQRWYYFSAMQPDEVLVFKSFDSAGVIGRACPHASFSLPDAVGSPRRSVELRVLCYVTT